MGDLSPFPPKMKTLSTLPQLLVSVPLYPSLKPKTQDLLLPKTLVRVMLSVDPVARPNSMDIYINCFIYLHYLFYLQISKLSTVLTKMLLIVRTVLNLDRVGKIGNASK